MGGAQGEEPLHLFRQAAAEKIDMDPIFGLLVFRNAVEHPDGLPGPIAAHADAGEVLAAAFVDGPVEDLRPEVGQFAGVGAIDTDREEGDAHEMLLLPVIGWMP